MARPDNPTAHNAVDYDRNVRKMFPFYEAFHSETLDLVRTARPSPRLWLDTGCGTGYLVERALPLFPQTRFVLADPAETMLEFAKNRLAGAPSDRVRFLALSDTESLAGQLDEAPDVVTAIMCHHYLDAGARRRAAAAVYDLLSLGGLYVTFEHARPASKEGTDVGLARTRAWQIGQGKEPEVVDRHMARFDTAYFPITVAEHLALLRDCGFSVAELLWYSLMQAGFYAAK